VRAPCLPLTRPAVRSVPSATSMQYAFFFFAGARARYACPASDNSLTHAVRQRCPLSVLRARSRRLPAAARVLRGAASHRHLAHQVCNQARAARHKRGKYGKHKAGARHLHLHACALCTCR
jgi:hypothetical protein